jgi:hypothetical protein
VKVMGSHHLTVHVFFHVGLEGGGVRLLARERLPEVLREVDDLGRLAERELVVVELQLRLRRNQSLDLRRSDISRTVLRAHQDGSATAMGRFVGAVSGHRWSARIGGRP